MSLRNVADLIIEKAIQKVLPDEAVTAAIHKKLSDGGFQQGRLYVVSIGKAGWQMAKTAHDILGEKISGGVAITKYDHVKSPIPNFKCFEAGHPIPDDNSFKATSEAIELVSNLRSSDTVLFLVSGGGSALFEKPLIESSELTDITTQLLACGADITEINTVRKRLSAVKGGKFARLCAPASIFSIVLSDIIGDPLDMIASGPAYPDSSTKEDALAIIDKYQLKLSKEALLLMEEETPKELSNVETEITGSVRNLCLAAAKECEKLGYRPIILTDRLGCEAKEAGSFLGSIAETHYHDKERKEALAFIAGGETVVRITGTGKGGRNQEIALSAAEKISGMENVCLFSVGSDGTDGPTDAAGGYVDGFTKEKLLQRGLNIFQILKENDSYHALKEADGLIMTGPTGTNVNDFTVLLMK